MNEETEQPEKAKQDYQDIPCVLCGSVWRIPKFSGAENINAILLTCPLCELREGLTEVP